MAKATLNTSGKKVSIVLDQARRMVIQITANSLYPIPSPSLTSITALADDLEAKYIAAMKLDKDKKALMRMAYKALQAALVTLLAYIQDASLGDAAGIISSGAGVKGNSYSIGILPHPGNVRTTFGNDSGEILLLF